MGEVQRSDVPEEVPDEATTEHPPDVPGADPEDYPRRWYLYRNRDVSGISGKGVVAYGVQFPDGVVAYRWTTSPRTTQVAKSIHDVQHIHGHEGKTLVRWIDG
ncbi:hypothetical protein K745_gp07 [Haloarcula hispanica virus PH1]|uniref:Uncharacterized protein n=1 Tax=Haloarcula hispanica virus PH1 TaxID=1282967 RepID=M4JG72_9VIRU|nr:hypothetical protein K745_gp07 [Haloarcula hispanica virus PH1]AGC65532.1 hypothetical protein HhPH1_gp07 [Haloarcula hispanica virus PH1]